MLQWFLPFNICNLLSLFKPGANSSRTSQTIGLPLRVPMYLRTEVRNFNVRHSIAPERDRNECVMFPLLPIREGAVRNLTASGSLVLGMNADCPRSHWRLKPDVTGVTRCYWVLVGCPVGRGLIPGHPRPLLFRPITLPETRI